MALRSGGALATIDPAKGTILERRAVCAAPRGVAYEPATDLIHVACADGQLVSFPAAGGAATRRLQLVNDLRDVVVVGADLQVTRFKSAQLPTYVIVKPLPDGGYEGVSRYPEGKINNVDGFAEFLEKPLQANVARK